MKSTARADRYLFISYTILNNCLDCISVHDYTIQWEALLTSMLKKTLQCISSITVMLWMRDLLYSYKVISSFWCKVTSNCRQSSKLISVSLVKFEQAVSLTYDSSSRCIFNTTDNSLHFITNVCQGKEMCLLVSPLSDAGIRSMKFLSRCICTQYCYNWSHIESFLQIPADTLQ